MNKLLPPLPCLQPATPRDLLPPDLFSRPFRKKGYIPLTTYIRTYKIGNYVDIKVNSAVHKGMPHKFYHDRTSRIWNVTKRALGVEINKQVGNRIIRKRIHVRVEHVQPSRCTEDFRLSKKKNDQLKAKARYPRLFSRPRPRSLLHRVRPRFPRTFPLMDRSRTPPSSSTSPTRSSPRSSALMAGAATVASWPVPPQEAPQEPDNPRQPQPHR